MVRPRRPVLVADGLTESLVLEVTNLPTPLAARSSYTCVIAVEGRTSLVPARLDAGRFIVCDKSRVRKLGNEPPLLRQSAKFVIHLAEQSDGK